MIDVSVIVPVFNDRDRISACIESIQAQRTRHSYEIIVVDDCSSDNTTAVLRKFDNVTLLLNEKNRGQAYCRNLGTSISKGKYLFFVDSDAIMDKDCIEKAFSYLLNEKRGDVAGVQGAFSIHNRFPNWPSLVYNALQNLLTKSPDLSYGVNSSCLFIKKDAFYQLGRFNEDVWYMEDNEFGQRAARDKLLFKRNLIFFDHVKRLNFSWLFKQHFIGGMQLAYLHRQFYIRMRISKDHENRYFQNNLKRLLLFATILFIALFYRAVFWLIPIFALLYLDTIRALLKASKNPVFVVWGFFVLNAVSVTVFLGFSYSSIFNIVPSASDRTRWLKSNLRQ
jgi:glycosyltransferase involved in cell wall biosynthesis